MKQDTINTINDIIDDAVTNELYEFRGQNFEGDGEDGALVFSITNNQHSEFGVFKQTVEYVMTNIRNRRMNVELVKLQDWGAIIEVR